MLSNLLYERPQVPLKEPLSGMSGSVPILPEYKCYMERLDIHHLSYKPAARRTAPCRLTAEPECSDVPQNRAFNYQVIQAHRYISRNSCY